MEYCGGGSVNDLLTASSTRMPEQAIAYVCGEALKVRWGLAGVCYDECCEGGAGIKKPGPVSAHLHLGRALHGHVHAWALIAKSAHLCVGCSINSGASARAHKLGCCCASGNVLVEKARRTCPSASLLPVQAYQSLMEAGHGLNSMHGLWHVALM